MNRSPVTTEHGRKTKETPLTVTGPSGVFYLTAMQGRNNLQGSGSVSQDGTQGSRELRRKHSDNSGQPSRRGLSAVWFVTQVFARVCSRVRPVAKIAWGGGRIRGPLLVETPDADKHTAGMRLLNPASYGRYFKSLGLAAHQPNTVAGVFVAQE